MCHWELGQNDRIYYRKKQQYKAALNVGLKKLHPKGGTVFMVTIQEIWTWIYSTSTSTDSWELVYLGEVD